MATYNLLSLVTAALLKDFSVGLGFCNYNHAYWSNSKESRRCLTHFSVFYEVVSITRLAICSLVCARALV